MENKSADNTIFSDIMKIFAGLLIGLASFQILVPLIWNYLSDLLHLERFTSYFVIVVFYFILPTTLILIWWMNNKYKLKGLVSIHPERKDEQEYLPVIRMLTIFFPAFYLLNTLMLLFPHIFDNIYLFHAIILFATLTSLYVLLRIVNSIEKNMNLCKVKQKRKYRFLIAVTLTLFFLFVVFEVVYLLNTDKIKSTQEITFNRFRIKEKAEVSNAFRLNELNEALIKIRKKFQFNLDRIQQMQKMNALYSNVEKYGDSSLYSSDVVKLINDTIKGYSILEPGISKNEAQQEEVNFDNTFDKLISLSFLIDRVSNEIAENDDQVSLSAPPYELEAILGYKKIKTIYQEDPNALMQREAGYRGVIAGLSALEGNVNNLSKRQLTIVISNTQMKGIFLFALTMFIMLSLYLLLKTNEGIFSQLLIRENDPEIEVIKSKSILNKGMLSDVWIILNILIWLLIPLFKPVTEENVKSDNPIQSLTFSRYVETEKTNTEKVSPAKADRDQMLTINYYSGEVNPVMTPQIDTAQLSQTLQLILQNLEDLKPSGDNPELPDKPVLNPDSTSIKLLRAIQKRVDRMNTANQDASALHRFYLLWLGKKTANEVKDTSFLPEKPLRDYKN